MTAASAVGPIVAGRPISWLTLQALSVAPCAFTVLLAASWWSSPKVLGAEIGQQYIRAGLVDEISIHLVPVLFGSGTRLFEHLGKEHIQLETTGVIETPEATHLRFRVV